VSDQRLRDLERRARTGDPEARAALRAARRRTRAAKPKALTWRTSRPITFSGRAYEAGARHGVARVVHDRDDVGAVRMFTWCGKDTVARTVQTHRMRAGEGILAPAESNLEDVAPTCMACWRTKKWQCLLQALLRIEDQRE
jgi:hypothetical protein